jgi:outer membrane protein insertion porin family/translocation and assembly module TamA
VLACSKIPPGRSAVDSVRIINAKQLAASETKGKLGTQESTKFLFLFQGVAFDYSVYDESVLQRDMARVERFYRSRGFFEAHARIARVRYRSPSHVRIEVVVDEGRPAINRQVIITGTEQLPQDVHAEVNRAALRSVPPGERFDETKFKDAEGAVKKALTDSGYAYATVDSNAELDVGLHTVDYGFAVVPGPRAFFGPIAIEGLDPDGSGPRKQEIAEGPLLRAINVKTGARYSTAAIDAASEALLNLGVFAAVKIVPTLANPPPPDLRVPLTVQVEPQRLRQITLGGGLELDQIKTEIHGVAGWEDRNFLGGLRDFNVLLRPAVVLYPLRSNNWKGPLHPLPEEWLKLELRQPGFLEPHTTGFVRPQFNTFPLLVETNPAPDAPVVGYWELRLPLGVQHTFWGKLHVRLDYTLQTEHPFYYPVNDSFKDPALETLVLSYPELVAHLDYRDSAVRPHEGIYLGGTVQVAGGPFATADDVRVQPEVRTYVPLAHGLTFATRASVGFLWAFNYGSNWGDELARSPIFAGETGTAASSDPARVKLAHDEQVMYFRGFFSGGPVTNRGYPLLGVAPHAVIPFLNPATATQQVRFSCAPSALAKASQQQLEQCFLPAGGFTLWELQNDVRFDISGPLSAAVFCDMSDVSPRQNNIRLRYLHLSCGAGAAYDTPVGPIRVDIGYRIPPLQVLGYKSEGDAFAADHLFGLQPTILGVPVALAVGIGQAF